jgi:hypothetical protein
MKLMPTVRQIINPSAILILKQIADFARPLGAQNPQSVAVQARCRQACTATDLHNENYC